MKTMRLAAATLLIAMSGAALAADLSTMSMEDLIQLDRRQMSSEERDAFRTEMRSRMAEMDQDERERFRNEMRERRMAEGGEGRHHKGEGEGKRHGKGRDGGGGGQGGGRGRQ